MTQDLSGLQAAQSGVAGQYAGQLGKLVIMQFEAENTVRRCATCAGELQVSVKPKVGIVAHAPAGAMQLLLNPVEPFSRAPCDPQRARTVRRSTTNSRSGVSCRSRNWRPAGARRAGSP